jgi:hypothetical protein
LSASAEQPQEVFAFCALRGRVDGSRLRSTTKSGRRPRERTRPTAQEEVLPMHAQPNGAVSAPASITITRAQRDAIHHEIRNYALSEGPLGDFQSSIENAGHGADAQRYWAQIACAARVLEQIGWDKRSDRDTYTLAIDHELAEWVRWRLDETEGTLAEHAQAFTEVHAGGDPWWDRRGPRRSAGFDRARRRRSPRTHRHGSRGGFRVPRDSRPARGGTMSATGGGDGCVVIDMKTRQPMAAARAKANHQPVKPRVDTGSSDYARDSHLRNEMFAEMLPILEGGVPKLSPGGSFRARLRADAGGVQAAASATSATFPDGRVDCCAATRARPAHARGRGEKPPA